MDQQYDYIIAGAGAAGLSLAWNMIESNIPDKKVLIVDADLSPQNDKTWCFWDNNTPPFSDIIHRSWHKAEVSTFQKLHQQELKKYTYYCLRSIDFQEKILQAVSSHQNFDLIESKISHLSNANGKAMLHTQKGDAFEADYIFQSCFDPWANKQDEPRYPLIQHFLGWEINLSKPVFDDTTFILMDFDQTFDNGIAFIYLLPWSKKSGLIEYTIFSDRLVSKKFYEEKISIYLSNRFNLKPVEYTIERKEFGKIPMQDRPFLPLYAPRILNIGTVGGVTKPSTGYTFKRIQKQVNRIVHDLLLKGEPTPQRPSPKRYQAYDLWLLQIIHKHPDDAQRVFSHLFNNNSLDDVFRFLAEESTLKQDLKIMNSVPYFPFIRAIAQSWNRLRKL